MSHRLFGTDGIRAPFGSFPLDRPTVTALAVELARRLRDSHPRPLVVLGGDPRDSTPEICRWLAAGLTAAGARYVFVGVLPTPGIAWLARRFAAAAGISVSASHNPHPDNGIKLIGGDGFKWSPEAEAELEARLRATAPDVPAAARDLEVDDGARSLYLDWLAATVAPAGLAGLRLVLDAANGAASGLAAPLFRGLGAEVTAIHDQPDGRNINRGCGSTHPEVVAAATVEHGAAVGVAFDGDVDRAILADETGAVRDGDAMLYLWARALRRAGELEPPAIVATSMSNLGLERALAAEEIAVVRCEVGDRAVVATMRARGIVLGGEQSGHLVHLGLTTTGDGLLTALQMARLVAAAGEPLSHLLAGFRRYPQLLRNVGVPSKEPLERLPRVAAARRRVEERLGADGRLVLRYSGTEPLARIMIEGPDEASIRRMADEIEQAIQEDLEGIGARNADREARSPELGTGS
jgi:phosphoglucosamine mutase